MGKFRRSVDRKQLSLLPSSVEDYVGGEDIVRYVDELVELLDLSSIDSVYSFYGRPAYEPRIIVKILVFGSLRGIRSARELSRECRENLRFMFLSQNEKPDFRTINLFRKVHAKALACLLRQTIEIGIKEEIIDLKTVAVDGTKIRAFAGRRSFGKAESLKAELDKLEKELEEQFVKDSEKEDEDEGKFDTLPPELRDKTRRKERLKAALEEYSKTKHGKPRQVSTTDTESRFMQGPEGARPLYNVQAAVDASSRMVVGGYATNSTCDHGQMRKVVESIQELSTRTPEVIVADRGYGAIDGFVSLEENNIVGFVSLRKNFQEGFTHNPSDDSYTCKEGRKLVYRYDTKEAKKYKSLNCQGCLSKQGCLRGKSKLRTIAISHHKDTVDKIRQRCDSELGKTYQKIRSSTVETLFGHLKYARKLLRFVHRGLERVTADWQFELAVYNIERLARLRMSPR